MSDGVYNPVAETAAQKVERLKVQIAQKLKERQAALGPGNESVERAEAMLAQVRARLMGGQVEAGRTAVRQWMDADGDSRR